MTIRLLSTYGRFKPNTIVTLASGTETALVAGGNATLDLSGGVPYDHRTPANSRFNDIAYGTDGAPLGVVDKDNNLLSLFTGIAAPGAPTGVTLTPFAGGVLADFTAPASAGGTVITGYEVTLSTGQKQLSATTTVAVNAPAGVAVTATVKAINGVGLGAASAASASATPTAYSAPAIPGAPTGLALTAGNGKVTANWTAAANGSAIRGTMVTLSNGAVGVAQGGTTTVDIATPNGIAVTATARAYNGEGPGPVSAVSNSVTPVNAVAPVFTAAATSLAATLDSALAYTPGTLTGSPTPSVVANLMFLGMALPISTVLTEEHRLTNFASTAFLNVREVATNSAGSAVRQAAAGVRPALNTAADPRFTLRPYMQGVPQVGRPVLAAGISAPAGTATLTVTTKFCVSTTELAEGRQDVTTWNAATNAAGTVANPTSTTTCTCTPAAGDEGKFMYQFTATSNSLGTVYYRTRAYKVRPAGTASTRKRFATAGGNRMADSIYTNSTGVTMNIFGYVDVPIGSANHSVLNVVFYNWYIPAANSGNVVVDIGNGVTITMYLCKYNQATNCPQVLVSGATPTIAAGATDIVSDDLTAASVGATEFMQGDRYVLKYDIAVPNGASVPFCSGGDADSTQAWLYNPAVTTITNKNSGVASSYSGTVPASTVGDGIPFDIIGTQVSGIADVDALVGDSISYNPQGRSALGVAHNRCNEIGYALIASGNFSRIGCTHLLYINNAKVRGRIKYANSSVIALGMNALSSYNNLGNADDMIAVDVAITNAIVSDVASNPDTVAHKYYRVAYLCCFMGTNADSTSFSSVSPERQTPWPRFDVGGDILLYYVPQTLAAVGTRWTAYIDHSDAIRLSTNTSDPNYGKVQPGCMGGDTGTQLHPAVTGGVYLGMRLRKKLHDLREV